MIIAKYIRLSSADEDARYGDKPESNSVTNQRMLLNRYLETHQEFAEYQVVEFQDDGRSGTNFDRPGVKALLGAVRRREIDCVIVKDFSRFGRDYVEVGNYLEQVFPFLGIRFISVNDGYDSKDYPYGSAGDINNGLRHLINELYSRDLSQKVKASRKQYAQRGQCIAAYPIYGYVKSPEDRRVLIPDLTAAKVVQYIFERCNAGVGPTQIAKELNRKCISTPTQRKRELGSKRQTWNSERPLNEWGSTAVLRILRDERYVGKLISIKTTRSELGNQNSSRACGRENWIVVPDAFEPIVSQESFNAAQQQLAQRYRPAHRRDTSVVHLFARKLKCGHCGLALQRRTVEHGVYYCCGKMAWNSGAECLETGVFEDDLARVVVESIRFQAQLAVEAEKRLDKLEDDEHKKQKVLWEQRRRIQMKIDQLAAQRAEAFLLFDQGELTRNEYDARCDELTDAVLEQQMQLVKLDSQQDNTQDIAILNCREEISQLKGLCNLEKLDRATVEKLIRTIRVYSGHRIEIVWNFNDSYMRLLDEEEQVYAGYKEWASRCGLFTGSAERTM